jgi:hypothetical protein
MDTPVLSEPLDLTDRPLKFDLWGLPDDDPCRRWVVIIPDLTGDDVYPQTRRSWAEYLAGIEGWHDRGPLARPGQVFRAIVFAYRWAEATRTGDGFRVPDCPPNAVFHAVTDEMGAGWWEEDMVEDAVQALARLRECGGGWVVFRETIEHRCGLRFDLSCDGKPDCRIVADPGESATVKEVA